MAPFARFILFCGLMLTASCSTSVAPSPVTTQPPPTQQSPAIEATAPIPTSQPTGVPTSSSSSRQDLFPPPIRIGWFSSVREGYLESYCWSGVHDESGGSVGKCTRFPPMPVDDYLHLSSAAGGGALDLNLDPPLPDALTLLVYQDAASPPVFSDQILFPGEQVTTYLSSPDLPPGDYLLYVSAIWEGRGNAKYSFAINIPKDERLPELHLLVDERTRVPGTVVGFCWMRGCGDGSLVLELFTPLYLWDGTFRLQFEEPIPDRVTLLIYDDLLNLEHVIATDDRSLEAADIAWEVELSSSYYILLAIAYWDEPYGDASYYFGVVIP